MYRRRLLPSYKAGRREKEQAREALYQKRREEAEAIQAGQISQLKELLDRILSQC